MTGTEEYVSFFKALADANRLKIVGLLAKEPMSVEAIAETLGISSSTTSHHLAKLAEVGLVRAEARGYYNIYHFQTDALETMAKRLLAPDALPAVVDATPSEAAEQKLLATFFQKDGRLKSIPVSNQKKMVILRKILDSFERNRRYAEKEVNDIMRGFHDDVASLRRYMIDFQFMAREKGEYWRIDA